MNTFKEDHKPNFVTLNGKITKFNEAKISIMSPGFTFAISVFEGLRGYWNKDKEKLYIFMIMPLGIVFFIYLFFYHD